MIFRRTNNNSGDKKTGWLASLTAGLGKSSARISGGIGDLFTKRKIDAETLSMLEDLLIEADLGPKTAAAIVADMAANRVDKDADATEIATLLAERIAAILAPCEIQNPISVPVNGPFTALVCGVNGAGKTTTMGKLAHLLRAGGGSVMLAAGDTFRAAAAEQLKIWADRSGSAFYARGDGADSAAVAFESYAAAQAGRHDVLLVDTAGRLQNKTQLMAELEKMIRVLKKQNDDLPHAAWLVLDATTGQNAMAQVEAFRNILPLTGLIVTKLDGSAKGGVVVALADRFKLPILWVGVGEGIDDLQPFSARSYACALVGLAD